MKQSDEFTISDEQIEYLDTWMNKVSRSFAIVVPAVEEPLRHYLSTAYLICRVIDNIEDCSQPHDWKEIRFTELGMLLDQPDQAENILTRWENETWPGLNADEEKIMGGTSGLSLWEIYGSIPDSPQAIIRRWTHKMASGMSQLDDPQVAPQFIEVNDIQVLREKQDYDDYCYIVAGTVGHMATELVVEHYGLPQTVADQLSQNAEACGRGLQKTNIVKDYMKDLGRGVSYVNADWMQEIDNAPLSLEGAPLAWIQRIFEDVLDDLDKATDYLLTLPYSAIGYRKASLLCLLPAYQTLMLAAKEKDKLFTPDHQLKISHETMAQCLNDTQRLALDDEGIQQYNQEAKQSIYGNLQQTAAPTIQIRSNLEELVSTRGA